MALIVPIVLVFQSFFKSGPLAFGDAPFFYAQGLKELISEPLAWTNKGINFGGINLLVWISPLTILYGILGSVLKLGNNLAVRFIFYFPSIILSLVGLHLLTKYLRFPGKVSFFASLIYVLNTYFILVVDGGQAGFALAYGFFPLAVLFLKKAVDKPGLNSYLLGLAFLMACSTADPRVGILAALTITVWQTIENIFNRQLDLFKNFFMLFAVMASWLGLSAYWIVPLIRNQPPGSISMEGMATANKLINSFLLFSPHWPNNFFGQINSPYLYFLLIPLLVVSPLIVNIFKKNKSFNFIPLLICYFIFCFATISSGLISKLPFGFAFRDTSKFFIPVIMFSGILIGQAAYLFKSKIFDVLIYVYLLLLVWPALFGKMNFVLSSRTSSPDIQKIYENLISDKSFYRALWIPERHPLSYESTNNPVIDGNGLIESLPFAISNTGQDPFNFLNSDKFIDWLKVLGIRYIILSGDQRNILKTTEQLNNWQSINSLILETKGLEKQNWSVDIPVFKVSGTYPRFFAIDKIYGVVGKPINDPNIPSFNYEDGLFDPNLMKDVLPESYSIVMNGGNADDLQMSFLQKYFKGPGENIASGWAVYSNGDYLKYKYELLTREVNFEDLDYSKGIAFSTNPGEKIEFNFSGMDGEYIFAYRSMIPENNESMLKWQFENVTVRNGKYSRVIENKNRMMILNVVALVPKKEFNETKLVSGELIKKFGENILNVKNESLNYEEIAVSSSGTGKYKFENPGQSRWIIFSDNFNPLWMMRVGRIYHNSYPLYSMINAFYIDPKMSDIEIQFKGQESVRWGEYVTILSGLGIVGIYLFLKDRQWKN